MSDTPAAGAAVPAAPRPAIARRRAKKKATWRRRRLVLLFMSPWILGFSVFFGYPLVFSAYLSFTHYDLLSAPRWIGTANYRYLFEQDQQIWPAVKNTLWMIGVSVPLNVLFAFGIALLLARARTGVGVFRTIFYLPALAPPVAATLAFVYGVIQGLQYFTQAYVAANIASGQASQAGDTTSNLGYPEQSTLFYPVLLYQNGFRYFSMGYASAMAIVLLAVSFVVTLVIVLNSRRFVHYTG